MYISTVTSNQQEPHTWDLKMKETPTVNRRDLLLGAAPTATLMILGAAATDGATAQTATAALDYVPTYFNPVEWTFINAAVGRLIPPGPGGLETGVPEFIDRQMELLYCCYLNGEC